MIKIVFSAIFLLEKSLPMHYLNYIYMKKEDLRTETISYRTTKTFWDRAAERASTEGKLVNEWCRDLAEQSLDDDHHRLPPGMQVLLAEIYALRGLVEAVFDLQSRSQLNEEEFLEVLLRNTESRETILQNYFTRKSIIEIDSEREILTSDSSQITPFIEEGNFFEATEQRQQHLANRSDLIENSSTLEECIH